jgi:hypothetical protein
VIINTKITNIVARVNLHSIILILITFFVPRKDNIEKIIRDKNNEIRVVEKVSFFDSIFKSL